MVPLVGNRQGAALPARSIIDTTAEQVFCRTRDDKIDYMVGTMIEVPRAAVTANQIAEVAEFFSFGTNDLTQMTFGYSRDDAGKFLPEYIGEGHPQKRPVRRSSTSNGVGQLVRECRVEEGRSTNPRKPESAVSAANTAANLRRSSSATTQVMNYVSCSPFRVPIARLAAAHAALNQK